MGIAEQQRNEERAFRENLPRIVATIVEDRDRVSSSEQIAAEVEVDQRTVFRWIQLTEQEIERYRRRRAVVALIPMWVGVVTLIGIGVFGVAGRIDISSSVVLVVAGFAVISLVGSALRVRGLTARAAEQWLQKNGTET